MDSGKLNQVALRMIAWSLVGLVAFLLMAWVGSILGTFILYWWKVFAALWALFAIAVLYLSRDPDPIEPSDLNAIVAPAYGTVDVIDEQIEPEFVKGPCQRVSIAVSVLDVHVQYAPVASRVAHLVHQGHLRAGGPSPVETLVVGFEPVLRPQDRIVLRLLGGTWGRRIVPWVQAGDVLTRSTRIGFMRIGSRVDVFLPRTAKLTVKVGDTTTGGQSVLAKFE